MGYYINPPGVSASNYGYGFSLGRGFRALPGLGAGSSNDPPALAAVDLGLALGSGTDAVKLAVNGDLPA
jgi:hypothetical protein